MTTLLEVLRFINVFSAAIAAGTLVMVLVVLIPMVRKFSPRMGLELHQAMDPRVDRYVPASVAVSGIAALLILVLQRNAPTVSTVFTIAGLLGTMGVGVVALGFNVRINRRIREWSVESIPPEYREVRERWNAGHAVRTASGVLALAAYIIAALAR